MIRLKDNQQIGNYTVIYFIKESGFCSSYRVMGADGKSFFMKLFDLIEMPEALIKENEPQEIKVCKALKYESIISFVDNGCVTLGGKDYVFLVTNFIVGELMADVIKYDGLMTFAEKVNIVFSIAQALEYMSSQGFIHNDICPSNIVLASNYKTMQLVPQIIDLGHASPVTESAQFPENDLDPIYRAPETYDGKFSVASDVFSLSVLFYELIFNRNPWGINENPKIRKCTEATLIEARKKTISYELEDRKIPESIINLLNRGLSENLLCRPSYSEIVTCLSTAELSEDTKDNNEKQDGQVDENEEEPSFTPVFQQNATRTQGGFADVAGMDELKKVLSDKVIWVLKNPTIAEEYRLLPPNGMLLYGPPGCGKTYFAQKFAEETGFKYILVNGSDLSSTLVHGSQLKIRELFEKAKSEAPVVICFDEFDAFVPVRGALGSEYQSDEVNEFLSQLNNCSERRIFVIGTTNRKDRIDPAILRKGRMDLHYLIPAPDIDARMSMFKLHLAGRPLSDDIDYEELSMLSEGYSSSDISYIVNEAALIAAMSQEHISQRHLVGAIKANVSSLTSVQRPKIGF